MIISLYLISRLLSTPMSNEMFSFSRRAIFPLRYQYNLSIISQIFLITELSYTVPERVCPDIHSITHPESVFPDLSLCAHGSGFSEVVWGKQTPPLQLLARGLVFNGDGFELTSGGLFVICFLFFAHMTSLELPLGTSVQEHYVCLVALKVPTDPTCSSFLQGFLSSTQRCLFFFVEKAAFMLYQFPTLEIKYSKLVWQ